MELKPVILLNLEYRASPFHSDNELDLRLTKKVIKELEMSHPPDSINHPIATQLALYRNAV
jgi:hypothetical protein